MIKLIKKNNNNKNKKRMLEKIKKLEDVFC